jgi:hypothetical protein
MTDTTDTTIQGDTIKENKDKNPSPFDGTWFYDERPEKNRTITATFKDNFFKMIHFFEGETKELSGTFIFNNSKMLLTYSNTYINNGKTIPLNLKDFGVSNPCQGIYKFVNDCLIMGPFTYTRIENLPYFPFFSPASSPSPPPDSEI